MEYSLASNYAAVLKSQETIQLEFMNGNKMLASLTKRIGHRGIWNVDRSRLRVKYTWWYPSWYWVVYVVLCCWKKNRVNKGFFHTRKGPLMMRLGDNRQTSVPGASEKQKTGCFFANNILFNFFRKKFSWPTFTVARGRWSDRNSFESSFALGSHFLKILGSWTL